jgi:hypothetical protein
MRTLARSLALPFLALLVAQLPAAPAPFAQSQCGSKAVLQVHPEVVAPGQLVRVSLTNVSSNTIHLPSTCVTGSAVTGSTCSGTQVTHTLCGAYLVPIPPGATESGFLYLKDFLGQELPPGDYSATVDYWPGGAAAIESCCFSVTVVNAPAVVTYCTAGQSGSGCSARLLSAGFPSASAPNGFTLEALYVESGSDGVFFFGTSGRQATPWGNGTSFQCVAPPVKRTGVVAGNGSGPCEGLLVLDLNAYWTAHPHKNPGGGSLVQAQLWYRDPLSTSNQAASLSDAIEFSVAP